MVIDPLHECFEECICRGFSVGDERLRNEFRDKDGVNGCPVLEILQFGQVADVGAEEDLPRREEDIIAITSEGTLIKGMK